MREQPAHAHDNDVDELLERAMGLLSLATPGEWYALTDERAGTIQLHSRTHASITARLFLCPETEANLKAIAAAANLLRSLGQKEEEAHAPR